MNNSKRAVRTESSSSNGYLIFRLLEGATKLRTVMVFGYSLRNNLWVRILGFGSTSTTIIPEDTADAKAEIASWCR